MRPEPDRGKDPPVDELIAVLMVASGVVFRRAADQRELRLCLAIREDVVRVAGWDGVPDRDHWDDEAIQVIGWDGRDAVCTGRIVLPGGPLPTEVAAGLSMLPRNGVVDVGRMAVRPDRQEFRHRVFAGLLAGLYATVRQEGFSVACGMMSPAARMLVKMLGVQVTVLGADEPYRGALRAPVRFDTGSLPAKHEAGIRTAEPE